MCTCAEHRPLLTRRRSLHAGDCYAGSRAGASANAIDNAGGAINHVVGGGGGGGASIGGGGTGDLIGADNVGGGDTGDVCGGGGFLGVVGAALRRATSVAHPGVATSNAAGDAALELISVVPRRNSYPYTNQLP